MTPTYIIEEKLLRQNLQLIQQVQQQTGAQFILALKAFALWKTFPIFRQYINATTASSTYEAILATQKFGTKTHTYTPAYNQQNIKTLAKLSSHLTFNSITQAQQYAHIAQKINPDISIGIRINPEFSTVKTQQYNPCTTGSRFGITQQQLPKQLPTYIQGFHCHNHCESTAEEFQQTLQHITQKFQHWLPKLKWINFGGGHLVTHKNYNQKLLIQLLNNFKKQYPNLQLILEPGSAFLWQTGTLVAQVNDIVTQHNIKTAILNVSFACHMPDTLEMPYKPQVKNAKTINTPLQNNQTTNPPNNQTTNPPNNQTTYRLAGNSCLAGDYIDAYQFDHQLQIGENIIFQDMIHYTTVKTHMFNGLQHPDIAILHTNGQLETLRHFTYQDYLNRMD